MKGNAQAKEMDEVELPKITFNGLRPSNYDEVGDENLKIGPFTPKSLFGSPKSMRLSGSSPGEAFIGIPNKSLRKSRPGSTPSPANRRPTTAMANAVKRRDDSSPRDNTFDIRRGSGNNVLIPKPRRVSSAPQQRPAMKGALKFAAPPFEEKAKKDGKTATSMRSPRQLQPSREFGFKSSGEVGGNNPMTGQHVEWKAKFDRPIEQLIYPSLQILEKEIDTKKEFFAAYEMKEEEEEDRPDEESTLDFDKPVHTLTWTANLREQYKPSKSFLQPTVNIEKKVYRTLMEEIEVEGEKALRINMREAYKARRDKDNIKQAAEKRRNSMEDRLKITVPFTVDDELDPEGGEYLYSLLTNEAVGEGNAIRDSSGALRLQKSTIKHLAYNRQKQYLSNNTPHESDHLLNGLMYYRIQNDLHETEIEEKRAIEAQRYVAPRGKVGRRMSSSFALRRISNMEMDPRKNDPPVLSFHQPVTSVALSQAHRSTMNKIRGEALSYTGSRNDYKDTDDYEYDNDNDYANTVTGIAQVGINPDRSKRIAKDALLELQLDAGVLPEAFIKPSSVPGHMVVDLSNYNIGDEKALCLGRCLKELHFLESIGLSENRLTSVSIPTIISNLNCTSVQHLDLSMNVINMISAYALSKYFMKPNCIQYLDLSSCSLKCAEVITIAQTLSCYENSLTDLFLSANDIKVAGASEICAYLSSHCCKLVTLDMSWNSVAEAGAIKFASALRANSSLVDLDLSNNSIDDNGGQRFAQSLSQNSSLVNVNMSHNSIGSRTCFVASQVLKNHPSMRRLDFSYNPLGEAGARSIFRTILRGLQCFVIMRGCQYAEDSTIFNYTYPTLQNPYVLDMSIPYDRAIYLEMRNQILENPNNCKFDSVSYQESKRVPFTQVSIPKDVPVHIPFDTPPLEGFLKVHFSRAASVPTLHDKISQKQLEVMELVIENGRTDEDRQQWVKLLCQDIWITTEQMQVMLDRFIANKTIAPGSLTKSDLINTLWQYMIDSENIFEFLCRNAPDAKMRHDVAFNVSWKRYQFNWSNPTGHWNLNLAVKVQRAIMLQIIAINRTESLYSRYHSHRGDTSQFGNWYNFRNGKYTVNGVSCEKPIDKDFVEKLPASGYIDFDYVSTTRPSFAHAVQGEEHTYEPPSTTGTALGGKGVHHSHPEAAVGGYIAPLITDDQLYTLKEQLGLSSRRKIPASKALIVLMDLQQASAKWYFTINNILSLLDAFTEEWVIQSKIVVCFFSRLFDLHRMDVLLRFLKTQAQQDIVKKLGYLNVINPLKIGCDYVINLKYQDNRVLLVQLMELAAVESADQITEEANTELPIQALYGSYTRALNDVRPEIMRFAYADFGVRSKTIAWAARKELMKKFLLSTTPLHDSIFEVIAQYKEMEVVGALSEGPIDLQYASYRRKLLKNAGNIRVRNSNKMMVNAMRAVAGPATPTVVG